MKKLALLLALLLIVGCFAACGGDGEKNEATEPAANNGGAAAQQQGTQPIKSGEEDLEVCPASDDNKHHYKEEVAGEPTCALPGLLIRTCTECNFSINQEIPALGHQGTGASCTEPSICTVCGELAEDAWGHDPESGICKNCGEFVIENATQPAENATQEATQEATEAATEATTA